MAGSKTGRSHGYGAARWLLALTVGGIVYASFYPFDWSWQRFATAQNGGYPMSLPWAPTQRSDIVANLLFYVPLGALLMAAFFDNTSRGRALLKSIALGSALSVCIEYLQYATPTRTPSLTDTLLNATSTAIGALIFLWVQRVLGAPQLRRRALDPAAYLLIAAWLAFHVAPFMPNLRFAQLRDSLHTVLTLQWSIGGIAHFIADYLILATVLRALVKREHFWLIYLLLIGFGLFARAVVVGQQLPFDELLGLSVALALIVPLRRVPHRQTCLPVLLVVIVCWLFYGLAPFDFVNRAAAFHWVPFRGFLDNAVERAYLLFFEKSFLYLGVGWLTVTGGGTARFAAGLAVGIAIFIEFAQRYLPGRVAEITDPLLVLIAALIVGMSAAIRPAKEHQHSHSQRRRRRSAQR